MSNVIKVDPEIQGGTPCFAGTRLPVVSLSDYLDGGHSIAYFLEQFPTVGADQVHAVLDEAKQHTFAAASGWE